MTAPSIRNPAVEITVLRRRLSHLRQALGARRLGLARRLLAPASGDPRRPVPFEILCVADVSRVPPEVPTDGGATPPLPYGLIHRLMVGSGSLDLRAESGGRDVPGVLREWSARRIAGWALPRDRRPAIFALAIWDDGPDPGARREETARLGLEALARALAPPDWLPLAPPSQASAAARLPLALTGHSDVARRLRRDFERLERTRGPVLVVGGTERGSVEVAAGLTGWIGGLEPTTLREFLESESLGARPCDARALCELSPRQQARLHALLCTAVSQGRRWAFFAPEDLKAHTRSGDLRSDLFWILASRQLRLPGLDQRSEDLPELFREVWRRRVGRDIDMSPEVSRALRSTAWPGDLAQLESEVRRLSAEHPRAARLEKSWLRRQLRLEVGPETLEAAVAEVERRMLEQALRLADGNKSQAARALRLSRAGLYRKLRRHGLWRPSAVRRGDDESAEPG